MDMQTPDAATDTTPTTPTTSLPRSVLNCLLRMLFAALPLDGLSPETVAETEDAARHMFLDLQPANAAEAAAAARSVAAHFAAMQMYARAARPGLSHETAMRLNSNANACSRTAEVALRSFRKPPPKAAAAKSKPPEPEAQPVRMMMPEIYQFQPRDRFGEPIPRGEWDKMTMLQRRATYSPNRDLELEATVIAEEEAAIAEQKALEAKQGKAPSTGT